MATLLTPEQFCDEIGITYNNLATYHLRRKFVYKAVGPDKWVDIDEPINARFLHERRVFLAKKSNGLVKPKKPSPATQQTVTPETATAQTDNIPASAPKPKAKQPLFTPVLPNEVKEELTTKKFEITNNLEQMKFRKVEQEVFLLNLKRQKMAGEMVPYALVQPIVFQCLHHIHTQQQIADEALLAEIAQAYNISKTDLAYYKGVAIRKRNGAITTARDVLVGDLDNLMTGFKAQRDVGERE
jgi:hypothetical protein